MRPNVAAILVLCACALAVDSARCEDLWIKADAKVTGDYTVDVTIETNIPGKITLAASLALQGQDPDDTFIGTSFDRVPVKDGKASVTINAEGRGMPMGREIPAGDYFVEVCFYPRWAENIAASAAAKITESIETQVPVTLKGSGKSTENASKAAEGQRWVMENFVMNMPWHPDFWTKKFGAWEELKLESGNPNILKLYYFKSIDMTLLVNVLKEEIVTYRLGRAHK